MGLDKLSAFVNEIIKNVELEAAGGDESYAANGKIDTNKELSIFNREMLAAKDRGELTESEYCKAILGSEIDFSKSLDPEVPKGEDKRDSSWVTLTESYPGLDDIAKEISGGENLLDARTCVFFDVKVRILKLAQGIQDDNYSRERMEMLLKFVQEASTVSEFMNCCEKAGINFNFKRYNDALRFPILGDAILPDDLCGIAHDKEYDTKAKPARIVARGPVYTRYYKELPGGKEIEITRKEYEDAKSSAYEEKNW